jgi:hypothetical protein
VWRERLPGASQRDARLADLLETALRSGIQVLTVDQPVPSEPAPGITQHRVELSARGRYLDLRRFIEAALQADAALALTQVSLSRPAADAPEVDARLQFSLLQRAAQPPRQGPRP